MGEKQEWPVQFAKSLLEKKGCTFISALHASCGQGCGQMASPPAPSFNHKMALAMGALQARVTRKQGPGVPLDNLLPVFYMREKLFLLYATSIWTV